MSKTKAEVKSKEQPQSKPRRSKGDGSLFKNSKGKWVARYKGKEFTGTQSNYWFNYAATYLTLLGPEGMKEVADTIMTNALYGAQKIGELPGVSIRFEGSFFEEFVVDFSESGKTVREINSALLDRQIFGGLDLSEALPELGQSALYCITEVITKDEIDGLVDALREILQ